MSAPVGAPYAGVGAHACLWRTRLSRDQRFRGIARIAFRANRGDLRLTDYALINLKRVRSALDTITLEDENAVIKVPIRFTDPGGGWDNHNGNFISFAKGNGGSKVRMTMPCGECRVYRVSTLDRALTRLGY